MLYKLLLLLTLLAVSIGPARQAAEQTPGERPLTVSSSNLPPPPD